MGCSSRGLDLCQYERIINTVGQAGSTFKRKKKNSQIDQIDQKKDMMVEV